MRFNYTYSQFNYHLIGVNVANFDKIRRTISEISGIKKTNFQYGKVGFTIMSFFMLKFTHGSMSLGCIFYSS